MVTTAELALQATRLMAVSAVLVRWKRIHWVVVLDGEVLAMEVTACISALHCGGRRAGGRRVGVLVKLCTS